MYHRHWDQPQCLWIAYIDLIIIIMIVYTVLFCAQTYIVNYLFCVITRWYGCNSCSGERSQTVKHPGWGTARAGQKTAGKYPSSTCQPSWNAPFFPRVFLVYAYIESPNPKNPKGPTPLATNSSAKTPTPKIQYKTPTPKPQTTINEQKWEKIIKNNPGKKNIA